MEHKSKAAKDPMEKPREMLKSMKAEKTDPNGSYTGVPKDKNEVPVQDADDL